MKKLIIILGMMIIFYSLGVSALLNDSLVSYYKLDNNDFTDAHGSNNGTNYNTLNGSGILIDGRVHDGNTDYVDTGISSGFTTTITVSLWFKTSGTNDYSGLMISRGTGLSGLMVRPAGYIAFYSAFNANAIAIDKSYEDNAWHNVIGTCDGSYVRIYMDGVLRAETAYTNNVEITDSYKIGTDDNFLTTRNFDGNIDEVAIWSRALTDGEIDVGQTATGEIEDIYNSSNALAYPFPVAELSLDFYEFTPINNSDISSSSIPYTLNFEYNITEFDEEIITCLLYEDNILVNTSCINATEQSYRNISRTFTTQINYTTFNYSMYCNDSSLNDTSEYKFINILIDEIPIDINFTYPLDDNTSATKEMLYTNISIYDDNLYNVTVNTIYPNGTIYHTNQSGTINTTYYNVTDILNLSGEPDGVWKIQVRGCDGHTAELIDNYAINKDILNKKLTYNDEISIKLLNEDITSFDTTRLYDRYTFEYLLSTKSLFPTTVQFQLTSIYPLNYIKDSEYKAHFISGKYWIDFELQDYKDESYVINIIDDYNAIISITTLKKELIFNSIGELNCKEENITFIKDSTPPNCTFSVQSPPDIEANSTGNFSADYNCIDTYSDINASKTIFTHTLNDTDCNCLNFSWRYPSNTKATGIQSQQRAYNRNESDWYESLFDNIYEWAVLEGPSIIGNTYTFATHLHNAFRNIYPLDRTELETNVSQYVEVYGNNVVISTIEFPVFQSNSSYVFHFYASGTSPSPLLAYYCNSSFFEDNLSYDSSSNCAFTKSFEYDTPYEHILDNVSYYASAGSIGEDYKINGVLATTKAYVLYTSIAGVSNKWKIYYNDDTSLIGNVSFNNSNTLFTSTDKGETIDTHNGTAINWFSIIHPDTDILTYRVYSCDILDNCGYSDLTTDTIGNVPVPPTTPVLLSIDGDCSFTGTYSDEFIIRGILGVDFNPEDTVTGNLSIVNGNGEYLIADNLTNGGNVINVTWNSTEVDDGSYYLKLTNCDDGGLCSSFISETFNIDNVVEIADEELYSVGRILFLVVIVMLIILFGLLSEFTNAAFLRAITFILLVGFNIRISAYSGFFSGMFIFICVLYFMYIMLKVFVDD